MVTLTDKLIGMDVRCRFLFTVCSLLIAFSDGSPFTDCIQSKGKAGFYEGSIDSTESGVKCMNWSDMPGVLERYPGKGLGDHSFCRNPDGRIRPWCFFPNSRGRIDWGYCDCKQGIVQIKVSNLQNQPFMWTNVREDCASSRFHFLKQKSSLHAP